MMTTKSFIQSIVFTGLSASFGIALAQPQAASLQDALAIKEAQSQTQLKQIDDEVQKANNAIAEANKRVEDLNKQKVDIEKNLEVPVLHGEFKDLLMSKFKHGNCVITIETENTNEFFITKGEQKIRLLLAPEDSPKKAVAKKSIVNNIKVTEYSQPGWSDKDPTRDAPFIATIRTTLAADGSEILLDSLFKGEFVDTKPCGLWALLGCKNTAPTEPRILCKGSIIN